MVEIISLIGNILLTSGLLGSLFTIRSIRKKALAEAEQAELATKKNAIDNETSAMENFQKYIVEPLTAEVEHLRKAVTGHKREILKLRKAIEKIGECEYEDECPVKNELKENKYDKVD